MPTVTFANLSAEKKQRIFDAAVLEFSTKRFREASINQIIKTAGISRGSFYQYFSDKEDLYIYLLLEIGKEKMAIASQMEALHPEADCFQVLEHTARSVLVWARERPLFFQIGLLMDMDDSQFMSRLRRQSSSGFDKLRELIERDKERGLIKPEVDTELIMDTFYVLTMHHVGQYYRSGATDDEQLIRRQSDVLRILKEGIACV